MLSKIKKKSLVKYGAVTVLFLFLLYIVLGIVLKDNSKLNFNTEGLTLLESKKTGESINAVYQVKKNNLILTYEPDSCLFTVEDIMSGKKFRSIPEITDSDNINALAKISLKAPVTVDYCTKGNNDVKSQAVNSSSLFSAYAIENGVSLKIVLEDIGIYFDVEISLSEDCLEVVIPEKSVKEKSDKVLLNVTVLPLLDAARQGQDGYAVLPDGIGGLTYFNREHDIYLDKGYSKEVYGKDLIFSNSDPDADESVLLPFFGIVKKDSATVCIIENGDAESILTLSPPSYKNLGFYRIHYTLNYRKSYMTDSSVDNKSEVAYEKERIRGDRKLKYYFLSGQNLSYNDVADCYKNYLSKKIKTISTDKSNILVRLFMMIKGKSSGIISNDVVMTTADQAKEIMGSLGSSNVYEIAGWYRDGYGNGLPKQLPPSSSIGGAKGIRDLNSFAKEKGLEIFYESDIFRSYQGSRDIRIRNYGVFRADSKLFSFISSGINGLTVKENINLLNTGEVLNRLDKNLKEYKKLGINELKLNFLGRYASTDYNEKNPLRRSQQLLEYEKLLKTVNGQTNAVSADGGNGYLIGLTDMVLEVPYTTDSSYMVDETAPVYSIAVSPYAKLYSGYVNRSQDSGEAIMKAFEYGLIPSFEITYKNTELLKYTDYNSLFSSRFGDWKDIIKKTNEDFKAIGKDGYAIKSHKKLAENVFLTEYRNKSAIFNYTSESYSYNGQEIAGNSYKIVS